MKEVKELKTQERSGCLSSRLKSLALSCLNWNTKHVCCTFAAAERTKNNRTKWKISTQISMHGIPCCRLALGCRYFSSIKVSFSACYILVIAKIKLPLNWYGIKANMGNTKTFKPNKYKKQTNKTILSQISPTPRVRDRSMCVAHL